MLRKLISIGLAGLLVLSCITGALATSAEPAETGNTEDIYIPDSGTYEDDFQTEYWDPLPDLTEEENAYDKLVALYNALGVPCSITYSDFSAAFAASGQRIEDFLMQHIDAAYALYEETNVESDKAQSVISQNEQSQEEKLQQAYIAVTEYSEYLGMPMMTDFETFCAQYASSGLYDVEVYRDQCKDEIYAAFLQTEEGAVPPEETKPSSRFTDISNHWAYSAISYMLNNGLMSGMTAYRFEPNTNITRAMFVSLLYRLAGRPNVSLSASSSNSFSDVRDQNSYYYYAVAWASSNGIVSGYTDGTFKPDNLVTREQCASFLYRFARYKNLNLNYSNSSLNQFADVGQVSSYALIPMKWAVSRGIMSGTTTTTLSPQTTCTRAMSAQLLKKLIDTLM